MLATFCSMSMNQDKRDLFVFCRHQLWPKTLKVMSASISLSRVRSTFSLSFPSFVYFIFTIFFLPSFPLFFIFSLDWFALIIFFTLHCNFDFNWRRNQFLVSRATIVPFNFAIIQLFCISYWFVTSLSLWLISLLLKVIRRFTHTHKCVGPIGRPKTKSKNGTIYIVILLPLSCDRYERTKLESTLNISVSLSSSIPVSVSYYLSWHNKDILLIFPYVRKTAPMTTMTWKGHFWHLTSLSLSLHHVLFFS